MPPFSFAPCFCDTYETSFTKYPILYAELGLIGLLAVLWPCALQHSILRCLFSLQLQDLGHWLRRLWRVPTKFEEKVQGLLAKRRLERSLWFMKAGHTFASPALLAITAVSIGLESRLDRNPNLWLNIVRNCFVLFVAATLMLVSLYPERFSVRPMMVLCFLFAITVPAFASSTASYAEHLCLMLLIMMVISIVFPDRRLAVVLNTLCLAWHVVGLESTPGLENLPRFSCLMMLSLGCGSSLAISFGLVSTSRGQWSAGATLQAEAEAVLRDREARSNCNGLRSLLAVMCDSVVVLGPDLSLAEPNPSLMSLLFRVPVPGMAMPKFTSFLQEGDVSRFTNFAPITDTLSCQACQV